MLPENIKNILACVDHTLLSPAATWAEIKEICDDALAYETASVCIPPSFVGRSKEYLDGRLPICTVIGFPNGYNSTVVKLIETRDALENGADEIDMVINIGALKEGNYDYVLNEIRLLKKECGDKVLKVIIETCLLSEEEKIAMCQIVTKAGADFIKTSTGFSTGGATRDDIKLFAKHIGGNVKMKAAGGIRSMEDAQDFIDLGCERLGTSSIVKILKNQEIKGY